jgi:hypothetical protein
MEESSGMVLGHRAVRGRRRSTGVVLALAWAGVVASCGSSTPAPPRSRAVATPPAEKDRTAEQILLDAAAALDRARDFHAEGQVRGPDAYAFSEDVAGPGWLIARVSGFASFDYLVVNGHEYVRGADLIRKAYGDAAAVRAGDAWIALGASSQAAPFADVLANLRDIARTAESLRDYAHRATKRGEDAPDGRRSVVLVDQSSRFVYVALDGPPYPVRISTGTFTDLSRFGISIAAPPEPLSAPSLATVLGGRRL